MSEQLYGAGVLSTLPYVKWAISHYSELPAIIAGAKAVQDAKGLEPKWVAVKLNGDRIVAALADFPGLDELLGGGDAPAPAPVTPVEGGGDPVPFFPQTSYGAGLYALTIPGTVDSTEFAAMVESEAINYGALGDGTIIKFLIENLPAIVQAIVQLVGLFK